MLLQEVIRAAAAGGALSIDELSGTYGYEPAEVRAGIEHLRRLGYVRSLSGGGCGGSGGCKGCLAPKRATLPGVWALTEAGERFASRNIEG